jgi:hypothetical protein
MHAARNTQPRDSITHLFLHCPEYQPARTWLQQIWEAVEGRGGHGPPTSNAALMLADQPEAWPDYPTDKGLQHLWGALRLLFLHALWCVHTAKETARQGSRAVALQVVTEAARLMRCQWRMAALADDTLAALPRRLLTVQLQSAPLEDFMGSWAARGILAEVVGGGEEGASRSMRVRLSETWPVALPPP